MIVLGDIRAEPQSIRRLLGGEDEEEEEVDA
jgi:hypothetical protein